MMSKTAGVTSLRFFLPIMDNWSMRGKRSFFFR